jgi:RES domain-containing protein
MRLWRVVKASRANEAFSGEGAFRWGGRWNSPGLRAIYCSDSKALAMLEVLAHMDPNDAPHFWTGFQIEVRRGQIERVKLPAHWTNEAYSQRTGDEWLRAGRTLALEVPSVLVPEEMNYLINPLHAEFAKLDLTRRHNFQFDLRLLALL